ncbi:hypothetical protein ACQQ62_05535, partial [Corynebacterium diphtheriae]
MLVVIVIFPRHGMMATFLIEQIIYFLPVANNVVLFVVVFWPVGWTRSSLKGWLMHFLCLT